MGARPVIQSQDDQVLEAEEALRRVNAEVAASQALLAEQGKSHAVRKEEFASELARLDEELETKRASVAAENDSINTELTSRREEIGDLEKEITSLSGDRQTIEDGNARLKDEAAHLTSVVQGLESKRDTLNSEIAPLIEQHGEVVANIAASKHELKALIDDKERISLEIKVETETLGVVKGQITSSNEELVTVNTAIQAAKEKLIELESETAEASQTLDSVATALEDLQKKEAETRISSERKEEELTNRTRALSTLEQDVDRKIVELKRLETLSEAKKIAHEKGVE